MKQEWTEGEDEFGQGVWEGFTIGPTRDEGAWAWHPRVEQALFAVCPNMSMQSCAWAHSWAEAVLETGSTDFLKGVWVGPLQHRYFGSAMHLSFILASADRNSPFALIQNCFTEKKKKNLLLKDKLVFKIYFIINRNICILTFCYRVLECVVCLCMCLLNIFAVIALKIISSKYVSKLGICVSKAFHFPIISNCIEFKCPGI